MGAVARERLEIRRSGLSPGVQQQRVHGLRVVAGAAPAPVAAQAEQRAERAIDVVGRRTRLDQQREDLGLSRDGRFAEGTGCIERCVASGERDLLEQLVA